MKKSKHDLSSSILWTTKMGQLKPINVLEVLPSDRFSMQTRNFVRFSPLVAPTMSIIKNFTHHWYVPTWLLWEDFEDFITGKNKEILPPKVPYISSLCGVGSLWDAMGLPVDDALTVDFKVNSFVFRAYWFIYFTYYADEDLNQKTWEDAFEAIKEWEAYRSGDTSSFAWILKVPQVSWKKDIFTTARPWRLKGGDVTIPLEIKSDGNPITIGSVGASGSNSEYPMTRFIPEAGGYSINALRYDYSGNVNFEGEYLKGLSGAGLDVTSLAVASNLARLRFRDSRQGSRYSELVQRMGANSSDMRLFLPQYLGGGSNPMRISEVVQTSQSTDTSNLGDMGGHGIGSNDSAIVRRRFNEHGFVLTFSFFRPDTAYYNITDRHWFYDLREDWFFKELENIGVQEVLTQELYPKSEKGKVFGYNDAYYYYRQQLSKITGEFRTLDKHWHLARMFESEPVLNNSFVECNPSNRIFADLVNDTIKVQSHNIVRGYRIVGSRSRLSL